MKRVISKILVIALILFVLTNATSLIFPMTEALASSETIPVDGISLNRNTGTVHVGWYTELEATVSPANATNKNVVWSVQSQSASDVVTVSWRGEAEALNPGTAVIRATSEENPEVYAECEITVPTITPVFDIFLDTDTTTITVGQSQQLTATVFPFSATNKNVVWTVNSPDESNVVSVSDTGLVTALKPGTAYVQATSAADRSIYAECTVTVLSIAVTGVVLNKTETSIVQGKSEQLTATVTPANATNKNVLWSVQSQSAENTVTVSQTGLVTAVNPGTAVIRAASEGNPEEYTECSITVNEPEYASLPANAVISDSIIDPSQSVLYAVDSANSKLYAVNYETKKVSEIAFNLTPERVAFSNGKLYVTLLKMKHNSFIDDPNLIGAIAIVDAANLSLVKQIDIDTDPFDIDVSEGNIFISSGSGQSTKIKSYSETSGQMISSYTINQMSYLELNSDLNRIYTITTDLSPRDYIAYDFNQGTFTGSHDSPYHGDYTMAKNFRISQDGKYIFNGSGLILTCDIDKTKDLRYAFMLNKPFTDIAFDMERGMFYTAIGSKLIYSYDYSSFAGLSSFSSVGEISSLYYKDSKLIALSKVDGTQYIVENIDIPSIPVDRVALNTTVTTINAGQSQQLTATVSPTHATNKDVIWTVSSQSAENTVTVSQTGLVTAVNPGTAVIRATSAADSSIYVECTVTVLLTIAGDVNVDGNVDALDFALLKRYLLDSSISINKENADINLDGDINAIDFAGLKMILLKM